MVALSAIYSFIYRYNQTSTDEATNKSINEYVGGFLLM